MAAEKIPSRYRLRVKQRLAVIEYVKTYGIKPASRYFGLARHTVRRWWRDWQRGGELGLVPRYPKRRKRRISEEMVTLIRHARTELEYGAGRTRIWLERVHQVRVTTQTIQRVFRDLGLPYLVKTRRRRPKQLKLFEKEHPGDSVQVDVKVVKRGHGNGFNTRPLTTALGYESSGCTGGKTTAQAWRFCASCATRFRFRSERFRSTTAPSFR